VKEDQLAEEEFSQLSAAPGFLRNAWPEILHQANSLIPSAAKSIGQIVFCGCGDSHHTAYSLSYASATFTGIPTLGLHSMQAARYWIPNHADRNTLVVGISASGQVARTIEAIEQANRQGSWTIGITTDPESDLASIADLYLWTPITGTGVAPGLLSYFASLMMGFASIRALATPEFSKLIPKAMDHIQENLPEWIGTQRAYAEKAAIDFNYNFPLVFLASGPAYGSALFGAAKYLEATGGWSWSQDVEEWAHLEYFCNPADLPIWLLSVGGRSSSREMEVVAAARAIGRRVLRSEWRGIDALSGWENEIFSPFMLSAGPYAFSMQVMLSIGEKPFRGFSGGRSPEEGGGASRIRSSWRIETSDRWKPETI
jgi:glucosamine--fructose-6-phosphate aminotransferase (isomerizing)